jgi:hypothetical protein
MLINKKITVKWHGSNMKWYISKGYHFTKCGDNFEINVYDLPIKTNTKVEIQCDGCGDIKTWHFSDYTRYVREDGKCYCKNCAMKLYGGENLSKSLLKNNNSFELWCIENNRLDYLNNWDYDLNKCKPTEICYSSMKRYWFKCPRGIHKSDLRLINYITNNKNHKYKCKVCNSFAQWCVDNVDKDFFEKYWDYEKNKNIDPWKISYSSNNKIWIKCQKKKYHGSYKMSCDSFTSGRRCRYCCNFHGKVHPLDSVGQLLENKKLLNLWSDKNKKSPYTYAPNSKSEVWWKCPEGKHKDYKRNINISNTVQFRCPECQFSKGEKRISEWLLKNNIEYIAQKEFDGLLGLRNGKLSYDFFLPQYNLLIEYQGEQHDYYIPNIHKTEQKFQRQQEHDLRKREYAKENNIKLLEIWYWDYGNIEEILELNLLK